MSCFQNIYSIALSSSLLCGYVCLTPSIVHMHQQYSIFWNQCVSCKFLVITGSMMFLTTTDGQVFRWKPNVILHFLNANCLDLLTRQKLSMIWYWGDVHFFRRNFSREHFTHGFNWTWFSGRKMPDERVNDLNRFLTDTEGNETGAFSSSQY